MSEANKRQVGGNHYGGTSYQHWDWVAANNMNYFMGMATKYVCRWKKKNGVEDLMKADHYVQKLIEIHRARVLPYPAERVPEEMGQLLYAYRLAYFEHAFCMMAATYTNEDELQSMSRIINDLINEQSTTATHAGI